MKPTRPVRPTATGGSRALTPTKYGYHVTNAAKLQKYHDSGQIYGPVFVFLDIDEAKKFRRRT